MYFLFGNEYILNNLKLFCNTPLNEDVSFLQLRYSYFSAIGSFQEHVNSDSIPVYPNFINYEQCSRPAIEEFSCLGEITPLTSLDYCNTASRITKALQMLSKVDRVLKNLFDTLVYQIVLMSSEESVGGGTSSAVGLLWINPKPEWNEVEIMEYLIHELCHQILFIDEAVHEHYLFHDDDVQAISSILKSRRPYYLSFHSAVVVAELITARQVIVNLNSSNAHPKTEFLKENLQSSIFELTQIQKEKSIFNAHALEILGRLSSSI